jgi:hypothetical protein
VLNVLSLRTSYVRLVLKVSEDSEIPEFRRSPAPVRKPLIHEEKRNGKRAEICRIEGDGMTTFTILLLSSVTIIGGIWFFAMDRKFTRDYNI